ncbi:MAG: hypothetical protein ACHQ49_07570 [Elusimicrobiota bacterium]
MKTATVESRPEIEYPKDGETIVSPEYTVRIAGPEAAEAVDVSIDQGPWRACRKEVGYWWYDWSGYDEGDHEIIARTLGSNGRWRMSVPRELLVAAKP